MKRDRVNLMVIIMLALALSLGGMMRAQGAGAAEAGKWVAVLRSDAPELDKDNACRELARIGSAEAVPALVALLGDEHLCTLARGALEAIPDPAAGEALIQALDKLKGRQLVGVISSLGNRKEAKAEAVLIKSLGSADDDAAAAAATALAKIGSAQATAELQKATEQASGARKAALADALLRRAMGLEQEGKREEALKVYDGLRGAAVPAHIARAATLGAVRERGEGAVPQVAEMLQNADWGQALLGLQAARLIPGAAMTKALLEALEKAPAEKQVLIIKAVAEREDKQVLAAMLARAQQGEPAVRVEAIAAIGRLGSAAEAPRLFTLAAEAQPDVAKAAQSVLAGLPGKDMDEAVMARVAAPEAAMRLLALEVAGKRQIKAAGAVLLKAADDPDRKVRLAALRALGDGGGPEEMDALLARLTKPEQKSDTGAMEAALRSICARQGDPQGCTARLLAALPQATVAAPRGALLRLVGQLGTPAGLEAIRKAGSDTDPAVRDAAFRALCDWPTPEVATDLLELAKSEQGARKVLALRGYIRLIGDKSVAPARKIQMCRDAAAVAQGDEEKRMLLGAMQNVNSPQILRMIAEHLDNPAVRTEAGMAAVSIAEKLTAGRTTLAGPPLAVINEVMQKVSQNAENAELQRRAKAVLSRTAGQGKK